MAPQRLAKRARCEYESSSTVRYERGKLLPVGKLVPAWQLNVFRLCLRGGVTWEKIIILWCSSHAYKWGRRDKQHSTRKGTWTPTNGVPPTTAWAVTSVYSSRLWKKHFGLKLPWYVQNMGDYVQDYEWLPECCLKQPALQHHSCPFPWVGKRSSGTQLYRHLCFLSSLEEMYWVLHTMHCHFNTPRLFVWIPSLFKATTACTASSAYLPWSSCSIWQKKIQNAYSEIHAWLHAALPAVRVLELCAEKMFVMMLYVYSLGGKVLPASPMREFHTYGHC